MSLRIGFDLDGVLADMESELARHTEILFGEPAARQLRERSEVPASPSDSSASPAPEQENTSSPAPPSDEVPPLPEFHLTTRQQSRLWRHVQSIDGFWESLKELEPGTVARLATLAVARRWEIIFLTKRPETAGATAQVQSQRWLEAHGFALPSVFVVQGSRGRIAAALGLDFVVDDRPENCLDVVVDSKARAILVWREHETLMPAATRRLGIGTVKTVAECLDILTQVDSGPEERPGLVDRLMRKLGLKSEPANA